MKIPYSFNPHRYSMMLKMADIVWTSRSHHTIYLVCEGDGNKKSAILNILCL